MTNKSGIHPYFLSKLGRLQTVEELDIFLQALRGQTNQSLGDALKDLEGQGYTYVSEGESFPGFLKLRFNTPFEDRFEDQMKQEAKYEYRLFWPFDTSPCFIDIVEDLFKLRSFSYKESEDFYILGDPSALIKIRPKSVHIKRVKEKQGDIDVFSAKEKMPYPVNPIFFSHLTSVFPPYSLSSQKDVVTFMQDYAPEKVVAVEKCRYEKKLDDTTKIEISNICIRGQRWKTICIESKIINRVKILKNLVKTEKSLRLNYNDFFSFLFQKPAQKRGQKHEDD